MNMADNGKTNGDGRKALYAAITLALAGVGSGGAGLWGSSKVGERLAVLETKHSDDSWDLDQDDEIADLETENKRLRKVLRAQSNALTVLRQKHDLPPFEWPNLGD